MDDQDNEKICSLKQMKNDYEEKIKSIEDAMKSGSKEPVTPEEINKLQNELFRMKNFGPNLRLVTIITISKMEKVKSFVNFQEYL